MGKKSDLSLLDVDSALNLTIEVNGKPKMHVKSTATFENPHEKAPILDTDSASKNSCVNIPLGKFFIGQCLFQSAITNGFGFFVLLTQVKTSYAPLLGCLGLIAIVQLRIIY